MSIWIGRKIMDIKSKTIPKVVSNVHKDGFGIHIETDLNEMEECYVPGKSRLLLNKEHEKENTEILLLNYFELKLIKELLNTHFNTIDTNVDKDNTGIIFSTEKFSFVIQKDLILIKKGVNNVQSETVRALGIMIIENYDFVPNELKEKKKGDISIYHPRHHLEFRVKPMQDLMIFDTDNNQFLNFDNLSPERKEAFYKEIGCYFLYGKHTTEMGI